jgi:hypothetical protein
MTAQEWKPIETAPKDGTPFLALCGWSVATWQYMVFAETRATRQVGFWPFRKDEETVTPQSIQLQHVTDGGGGITYVSNGRLGLQPTHWMPLPPPPES